jgi:hypothetical protein
MMFFTILELQKHAGKDIQLDATPFDYYHQDPNLPVSVFWNPESLRLRRQRKRAAKRGSPATAGCAAQRTQLACLPSPRGAARKPKSSA